MTALEFAYTYDLNAAIEKALEDKDFETAEELAAELLFYMKKHSIEF